MSHHTAAHFDSSAIPALRKQAEFLLHAIGAKELGRQELCRAARDGQSEWVSILIGCKADLNECDAEGRTPLILASLNGHVKCCQLLAQSGAALDAADCHGNTALMYGAHGGRSGCVKWLIHHKASLELRDREHKTALLLASMMGHEECVWLLTEAGAAVGAVDARNRTALMLASMGGHYGCATQLTSHQVSMAEDGGINSKDEDGQTALHLACWGGHQEVVERLIAAGVSLNLEDNRGRTSLMLAAASGHAAIVKLLASAGADLNLVDTANCTAIMFACDGGGSAEMSRLRAQCVLVLLEAKADVNKRDSVSQTALLRAISTQNCEAVLALIQGGQSSVNVLDAHGQTPLLLAAETGNESIIMLLTPYTQNIDCRNSGGDTALLVAIRKKLLKSVVQLINSGADLDLTGGDGNTPLVVAVRHQQTGMVKALLDGKCNPNCPDAHGDSPLDIAANQGDETSLFLLVDANANLEIRNKEGDTPLLHCARKGYNDCVQKLIAAGADTTAKSTAAETALMVAYKASKDVCFRHLAIPGPALNMCDQNGNTPLLLAASDGKEDLLEALIAAGAHLDTRDGHGDTPILRAFKAEHAKCFSRLARAGAQVNVQDSNGDSLVLLATKNNRVTELKSLIEVGAALDLRDVHGKTAVIAAAERGFDECIEILARAGAGMNIKDNDGRNGLWLAAKEGHGKAVVALIEGGAFVNDGDDQQSALSVAITMQHEETVKLLLTAGAVMNWTGVKMATADALKTSPIILEHLKFARKAHRMLGNDVGYPELMLGCYWDYARVVERIINSVLKDDATPNAIDLAIRSVAAVPNKGITGNEWLSKLYPHENATMRLLGAGPIFHEVPASSVGTLMILTEPKSIIRLSGNPLHVILDAIEGIQVFIDSKDPHRIHVPMLSARRRNLGILAGTLLAGCENEVQAVKLLDERVIVSSNARSLNVIERALDLEVKSLIVEPVAQDRVNVVWISGPVSPRLVFSIDVIFYFLFLVINSATAVNPCDVTPTGWEWMLLLFVLGLIYEEVHQAVAASVRVYVSDGWNVFDMIMLSTFMISVSFRIAACVFDNNGTDDSTYACLCAADIVHGAAIVMAYLRILNVLLLHHHMGPLLLMCAHMMKDMFVFSALVFTINLSFSLGLTKLFSGATTPEIRGAMPPNSWVGIFVMLFWSLFGNIQAAQNAQEIDALMYWGTLSIQSTWQNSTFSLAFAVFLLVAVFLLLNLLIAIMNDSYTRIAKSSDSEFKFARTNLIFERACAINEVVGELMPITRDRHQPRHTSHDKHGHQRVRLQRPESLFNIIWLLPPPINLLLIPADIVKFVQWVKSLRTVRSLQDLSVASQNALARLRRRTMPDFTGGELNKMLGLKMYVIAKQRGRKLDFIEEKDRNKEQETQKVRAADSEQLESLKKDVQGLKDDIAELKKWVLLAVPEKDRPKPVEIKAKSEIFKKGKRIIESALKLNKGFRLKPAAVSQSPSATADMSPVESPSIEISSSIPLINQAIC